MSELTGGEVEFEEAQLMQWRASGGGPDVVPGEASYSLYFGERTVVEVEGCVRWRLWRRVWSTRTLRSPRHGDRRGIMWRGAMPVLLSEHTQLLAIEWSTYEGCLRCTTLPV